MRTITMLLSVVAALALAGSASAKEHSYKDKDGGTITVSGSIQYLGEDGKPKGPKVDMPLAGPVTIGGEPAPPVGESVARASRAARVSAASGCASGYATIKKDSYPLGTRLWQFWHHVSFCWQYPNIVSVSRWTDGKGSSGWSYDGVVSSSTPTFFQWCCNAARSGHRRQFRGGFHFPVWITQQTAYPWIRVEVHGNGTTWYAAGT